MCARGEDPAGPYRKGHAELGEDPRAAALRETREEAGVACSLLFEVAGFSLLTTDGAWKDVRVWVAECVEQSPLPDGTETEEAAFFDLSHLPRVIKSQEEWLHKTLSLLPRA